MSPTTSHAHKAGVFAYLEGGVVKGEGYFAGGEKAKECEVVLHDAQDRELASGRTDAQGVFSLPAPASPPPWLVVLKAGQGHQASYTLRAEEIAPPATAEAEEAVASPASGQIALSPAQLEELVGRAVERRLEPLKAQLARLEAAEASPGLRDILGGVGYILGLMGLAAYLKRRKS